EPADRVPLPPALPALRRGPLRRRRAGADPARHEPVARREVPLPARALADDRRRDAPAGQQQHHRRARLAVSAALRRLAALFFAIAGATALGSLLIGLLAGSGVWRALALGWYIVGSVLLISGFFVGNRGPSRPQGEGWSPFSTRRWVRWA